jgi:hypothetical protein
VENHGLAKWPPNDTYNSNNVTSLGKMEKPGPASYTAAINLPALLLLLLAAKTPGKRLVSENMLVYPLIVLPV